MSQLFASGGQRIGDSASASVFPGIRVFPNESALRIRWAKYWSFSFNISPSNEHPGLIYAREGAGCGSVGDVPGAWLASAPLSPSLWLTLKLQYFAHLMRRTDSLEKTLMLGKNEGTLARDGVSREVPCSALKGETVPDSLPATPRSPPTRRVPPRGPLDCKEIQPVHPKGDQS